MTRLHQEEWLHHPRTVPGQDPYAVIRIPNHEPWMADAACDRSMDPDAWFDPEEIAAALRVCRRCGVRAECLAFATSADLEGVWGGTIRTHRHRRRQQKGTTTP